MKRICAALFLLLLAQPASAMGISPPEVFAANVFAGIPQTKTIHISRSPDELGELTVTVKAGGDYAGYLTYEPSFSFGANQESVDYSFQIDPKTAAPGSYSIPLTFLLVKKGGSDDSSASGSGMRIVTGIAAKVSFTVTGDQVTGYSFTTLAVSDVETDGHPFVSVGILSTGNVDWKPERATVTFTDQDDPTRVIVVEISGDKFKLVAAGQLTISDLEVFQTLPEGTYVATVQFYDKDIVVGELTSKEFSVYPVGTLLQRGELSDVTVKKNLFEPGERLSLDASFKNVGSLRLSGVLMTEIYREGTYVDVVRGDETEIGVGEEASISQVMSLKDPGSYVLTSYFKYGNKKTMTKDVAVTVQSPVIASAVNSTAGIAALSGGILLAVALVVIKRRGASLAAFLARRKSAVRVPKPPAAPKPVAAPVIVPAAPKPVDVAAVPEDENRRW